jgi:hypothetical protein
MNANVSVNRRRAILGGVGTLLVATVLAAGGLLAGTPLADASDLLGNDYFVVAAIGAVGLLVAAPILREGHRVEQLDMPDADGINAVPAPGDGFEERIDSWWLFLPAVDGRTREAVRERLRGDAVELVRRSENCGTPDARRRVAGGEWTDDEVAAAFLADEEHAPAAPSPVAVWLAGARRGQSGFGYAARRTADALVRYAPDERGAPGRGEGRG